MILLFKDWIYLMLYIEREAVYCLRFLLIVDR